MSTENINYVTPSTTEFYSDCIRSAVSIKLDRMPDQSWRRMVSDKPLGWFLENTEKITSSRLIVKKHLLENEEERWMAGGHLEINAELRENNTTYLLSIEIGIDQLEEIVRKYQLKRI